MSKDNLIISTDAAKTIGLNEAVLLQILNNLCNATQKGTFTLEDIQPETPFWKQDKLSETLISLSAKGIIRTSGNDFTLVKQKKIKPSLLKSLLMQN